MKVSVEGAEPDTARLVVVLLHGGGSPALDFLAISQQFEEDDDICWLAPQALHSRWFPGDPSSGRGDMEPHFTVSVQSVLGLLQRHAQQRLVLAGFADGASVTAELLASPELPSSVVAGWLASGGLAGPEEQWPDRPKLSIPLLLSGGGESIEATARYFTKAGSKVTRHHYDGPPQIDAEEFALARRLLREAK